MNTILIWTFIRMIWDEVAMPGYGLYERALGAAYLNGLWEAIEKNEKPFSRFSGKYGPEIIE